MRNAGIDPSRKIVRERVLAVHLPDIEGSGFRTQQATHQEQESLVYIGLVKVQHARKVVARPQRDKAYLHPGRKARFEHRRKHGRNGTVATDCNKRLGRSEGLQNLIPHAFVLREFRLPVIGSKAHGFHDFGQELMDYLALATATNRVDEKIELHSINRSRAGACP